MRLYESQENFLKELGDKPYLWCDVGTGKTIMALANAYRRGEKNILIVCPASVRDSGQWELEVKRSGYKFDDVKVIGYTTLQKMSVKVPSGFEKYFVIFDEAHRIKNSQSKQGLGAYNLCKIAKGYLFLSGTPFYSWIDFCNIAKITGLVRHKTEFKRYFVDETRYKGFPEITGYRNTDLLEQHWKSIHARLKAKDAVDLPDTQYQYIDIKCSVATRKEYQECNKIGLDVSPFAKGKNNKPNFSKRNWAKRQVLESDSNKVKWIIDKVQDIETCLIYVNTLKGIETLSNALDKAKLDYGIYSGARKDNFDDHDIMIVQYQAGSEGLNLQHKFNTIIFLSPTFSPTILNQAIGRVRRNGQAKSFCELYFLRGFTSEKDKSNQLDFRAYRALAQRKKFRAELEDGGIE